MNIDLSSILVVGGVIGVGLWYYSDMSSKEHHPSTIVAPPANERSNYFQNSRSMWIYTTKWIPEKKIIGLVFLIHGHGEHINRPGYHYLANSLVASGYAVFGMDLIGHGKSNGTRGHVRSIGDLVEDYEIYANNISQQYPDLPRFAIGHSMGGLVLLNLVKKNPNLFQSIILSAPAACEHLNPNLSDFKRSMGHTLSMAFPKLKAVKLNIVHGLTRNQAAMEAYLKDPLINQGFLDLCTGDSIVTFGRYLWQHLPEITIPIYIIHGKEDKIVHPKGSQLLIERIGTPSTHKKILIPELVKHEAWEDPLIDELIISMKDWFAYTTPKSRALL